MYSITITSDHTDLAAPELIKVADPGFPVGGRGPRRRGRGLPRRLHFENFVCQNERIWTLGGRAPGTPPLDPPMHYLWWISIVALEYEYLR